MSAILNFRVKKLFYHLTGLCGNVFLEDKKTLIFFNPQALAALPTLFTE